MEEPSITAEVARTASAGERKLIIGRFAVPEQFDSTFIDGMARRLGSVGVESYQVEIAGAGEPILDLEDVTYVGEGEIQVATESIVAERSALTY